MKHISILFLLCLFAFPAFGQQVKKANSQQMKAKYVKQVTLDANHRIVLTEKPAPQTALKFDISHWDMGDERKTRMLFGMGMPRVEIDYASKTATLRFVDVMLANPNFTLEKMNKRLEMLAKRWNTRATHMRAGKMPNGKARPASAK